MFARGHGSVVLELVAIESVSEHASNVPARGKCALNLNRGSSADGRLNCGRPKELEAGFVDDLGGHDLGIADLWRMFGIDDVETLIRQVELPSVFIFVGVVKILVSRRERVGWRQLVVEARTDFVPPAWIRHDIAKRNDLKRIGIYEGFSAYYLEVNNVAALGVEKKRDFLAEGPAVMSTVLGVMMFRSRVSR